MATRDDEILSILTRMVDEQREHRAETSRSFSDLDKKVDLHIQKTEYELAHIHQQDERQNELLDQHIAGVNTLRKIHEAHVEDNEKRFAKVEEPQRAIKLLTRAILWAGGIGTAATGILEFVKWLKGV